MDQKQYTIIYTTIDKQIREYVWETKDQKLADGVVHFLTHDEWPELARVDDNSSNWNLSWGLTEQNILNRNAGILSMPNAIQYGYYYFVVTSITRALGEECVRNQELAKAILKKALAAAKDKDKKFNEKVHAINPHYIDRDPNMDKLKRAKNRLNYYKRKAIGDRAELYDDDKASTYANIIEEYNLFTILEIQE